MEAEVKEVLERVEKKIDAVRKVHGAIAFIYWECALSILYLITSVASINAEEYAAYWTLAAMVYYFVWKRTKTIISTYSPASYMVKALAVMFIALLPLSHFFNSVGALVLCGISIYLLTLSLMIWRKTRKYPVEMLPATLSFVFLPLVLSADNPLYVTGYVIIVTYSVTALLYLSSAVGLIS